MVTLFSFCRWGSSSHICPSWGHKVTMLLCGSVKWQQIWLTESKVHIDQMFTYHIWLVLDILEKNLLMCSRHMKTVNTTSAQIDEFFQTVHTHVNSLQLEKKKIATPATPESSCTPSRHYLLPRSHCYSDF